MKKQNGFIATSLLYTFFLAFVTLFIGVVTLHLQNRVYLNKLEDSSKNAIYLREMKENSNLKPTISINSASYTLGNYDNNIFTYYDSICSIDDIDSGMCPEEYIYQCNFAKCETIYQSAEQYILEGCECLWKIEALFLLKQ